MTRYKSFLTIFAMTLAITACTTTTIVEEKAPLPIVPEYVKIPHPAGFDLADLRAILVSPLAPKDMATTFKDTCDETFKALSASTESSDERKKGATELVTNDPEHLHWCFYAKISKLEEVLQGDTTWSERQKQVLDSFAFLSPIANAFLTVYHDSRYLRWATSYYSKISEWVFFKKLAPTAENTLLLTNGSRELEPWIAVQRDESKTDSVFGKYGISLMPSVAGAVNPYEVKEAPQPTVNDAEIRANALKIVQEARRQAALEQQTSAKSDAAAQAAGAKSAIQKRLPASANADGMSTLDPAKLAP